MSIIPSSAGSPGGHGSVVKINMIVTEPHELNRDDIGMTPASMLLSSLGSCQCLVAQGYAGIFGIDLQDFWVELEAELHDPGLSPGSPAVKEVRYTIHVKTESLQDKVNKFVDFIQRRCTVAKTLGHEARLVPAGIVVERMSPGD